jgi:shikimate 5-dehydrogenase
MRYTPASRPTIYFIGVSTGKSSIMKVFPAWAKHLGLDDAAIVGMDFPIHADAALYREAAAFIRTDPLSLGALVTTHKIDFYRACLDTFDEIDPHARLMGEISCLSKRDGKFICKAKDPISCGLALDSFLGQDYFARTGGALFSMGTGGSTIAITWHLMRRSRGRDVPSHIVVSDRNPDRLNEIARIHRQVECDVPLEYVLVEHPPTNDAVLSRLPPASLVINATGLGKDAPGSPLTDAARFPDRSIAWDLNYRGDLVFLDQARRQERTRKLQVEDGWTYFIHGWTQVIAEVFGIEIPTSGTGFDRLREIAVAAGATAPAAVAGDNAEGRPRP